MGYTPHPYQHDMVNGTYEAWSMPRVDNEPGFSNALVIGPTGCGKTVVMSHIVSQFNQPTVTAAHRLELVSQVSMALATNDITHRIIASEKAINFCISKHIRKFGKSFYHPNAIHAASGVQTLVRRGDTLRQWMNSVTMWNMDEAHHVCADNMWGKSTRLFPNARGVGFTASPIRTDRKPLGRVNGGLFDYMVKGPTMRWLIDNKRLCEYRLIAPTISVDRSTIKVSAATGELNEHSMRKAMHKSRIVGDIVECWLEHARGKKTIVFVADIPQAAEVMRKFREHGIRAEAVSAKTDDDARDAAVTQFAESDLDVLINVDLFGEGFDVPRCECVVMGRPTESFGLYLQQFGRALRTADGKTHGLIIDHVGNWERHGLPDMRTNWSLTEDVRGTSRQSRDPDQIPTRRCLSCFEVFAATTRTCPKCGTYDEPASRSGPEHVNGELREIDPEVLQAMRNKVGGIIEGRPLVPSNITDPIVIRAIENNFRNRQATVHEMRDVLNMWAGIETQMYDRPDSELNVRFYNKFGVDPLTAQTLKVDKMRKLMDMIRSEWI